VEDDLAAIYDHYEQFDLALLSRFVARLDEQVERIQMFLQSGAIRFESYRRALLKRFPYMAVYLVGANQIDVLAIVAVRRDPAWIETRFLRGPMTTERSANSPQEVQPRPRSSTSLNGLKNAFPHFRLVFQHQSAMTNHRHPA
jgi:plasmid stabilization system protein ParE